MMSKRKSPSRSVTFRLPADLYDRLEYVAFAELEADEGERARVRDVNVSEFLRAVISEFVQETERCADGGADALRGNYKRAEARDLREQLTTAESALAFAADS